MMVPRLYRARAIVMSVLFLAGIAGCVRAGTAARNDDARSAQVVVENNNFADVNVYAIHSGQRIRLGTVTGNTTRTFAVPRTLVGSGVLVRFLADFIGSSRAPVSEEVVIWPGDSVGLMIPAA